MKNLGKALTVWIMILIGAGALHADSKPPNVCPAKQELIDCLANDNNDGCEAVQELNRRLQAFSDRPILAFDHVREAWVAGKMVVVDKNGTKKLELDPAAVNALVEFDVNCVPRLDIGSRKDVLVVVFNTNPLLYVVDPGEIEEIEPEALAQLQQLAGLLGNGLAALLRQSQDSAEAMAAADFKAGLLERLRENLEVRTNGLDQKARPLQQKINSLNGNLGATTAITFKIRSIQRSVEGGMPILHLIQQIQGIKKLSNNIDQASVDVATARAAVQAPGCVDGYEALADAIEFRLRGSDDSQKTTFLNHLQLLEQLRPSAPDFCTLEREIDDLGAMAELLRLRPPTEAEEKDLRELSRLAQSYTRLAKAFGEILKQADTLLGKAPDAAKLADQLEALKDREKRATEKCDSDDLPPKNTTKAVACLSTGVIPILDGNPRLRWDRIQKRPFIIKADAPFADEIAKRRKAEVTAEYKIRHRFFADFSIGMGIIYTDIADPTFKAVTNPLDSETKVIARTDEDTRAGELALLLHYPLQPKERDGFFRFGVEFGAGLDADQPSFFIGPAFSFGKYARLGVGWSWQEVRELTDDQDELRFLTNGEIDPASLSIVSADEDIRTRDHFTDDYYISLMINFSSLPFFKSDSE